MKVSVRRLTPMTLRGEAIKKKRELRDRILAEVRDLSTARSLSRGKLLSIVMRFYLYTGSEEEGSAKKDLDNLMKIVLDTLPDYMDRRRTELGLGLMEGDSDYPVFEVNATKELVSD